MLIPQPQPHRTRTWTQAAMCLACVAITSTTTSGQCDLELPVPGDVGAGAYFGTAVAMDGELLAVGAPLDTGNDWASGVVYVFRRAADGWVNEGRLRASDGEVGDMLGVSVDIHDGRIVAGAWFDDDHGSNSGAAYVFTRNDNGAWTETAKLTKPNPGPEDAFGRTVAISGERIAVGAPLDDDAGSSSGTVTTFTLTGGAWVADAVLTSPIGANGDEFGLGLDLDGSQLLVGSPWSNDGTGHADLFTADPAGTWTHEHTFNHPDPEPGEYYAFEPALGDEMVALGAYLDDDGTPTGRVFIHTRNVDGDWSLQQTLRPDDSTPSNERFGVAIDLDGSVMAIGADQAGGSGAVHIYDRSGDDWTLRTILQPEGLNTEAEFGWFVDVDGDQLAVGAYGADLDGATRGAAWVYAGMQTSCDCPGDTDGSGAIDVNDLLAVIGAWNTDNPTADVNSDGIVNVGDLLAIIAGWGGCG